MKDEEQVARRIGRNMSRWVGAQAGGRSWYVHRQPAAGKCRYGVGLRGCGPGQDQSEKEGSRQTHYCTPSVTPLWLMLPPIDTRIDSGPGGAPAGICTLSCITPATEPGASPA